jgi:hypothetical protein
MEYSVHAYDVLGHFMVRVSACFETPAGGTEWRLLYLGPVSQPGENPVGDGEALDQLVLLLDAAAARYHLAEIGSRRPTLS